MKVIILVLLAVAALAYAEPSPSHDFQLSDYVEIKENGQKFEGRSSSDVESSLEDYLKTHDAVFKLPFDSTVSLTARNLENEEVDLKLNLGQVEGRKKSKLKRVIVPIFIFILIKAMVLIPLALGILAIKTWNALQLSFGSFVVAIALAVWQLCKKVAGDSPHPHIITHGGWEDKFVSRTLDSGDAHSLAYAAYAPKI